MSSFVNRLAVLVVNEANAGHPHLAHHRHVRGNVLRFRRPTFAFTILVIADAVDGDVFSVEEESLIRIEANLPNAEGDRDTIEQLGGLAGEFHHQAVEIRVLHTLPEMRMQHRDVGGALYHARWFHGDELLLLCRDLAHRVNEKGSEHSVATPLTVVAHPYPHLHLRPARRDGRCLRIDSGGAIVQQIKVNLLGEDKAYRDDTNRRTRRSLP